MAARAPTCGGARLHKARGQHPPRPGTASGGPTTSQGGGAAGDLQGLRGREGAAGVGEPSPPPHPRLPRAQALRELHADGARGQTRRLGRGEARRGAEKGRGRRSGEGAGGGAAARRSRLRGLGRTPCTWARAGRGSELGPRAATAMRGARGAWDFLGVLLLLFRVQTGGRARAGLRRRDAHPGVPGGRPTRREVCGLPALRPPVPTRCSLGEDSRRPRDFSVPCLAHLCGESPACWWGVRGCACGGASCRAVSYAGVAE